MIRQIVLSLVVSLSLSACGGDAADGKGRGAPQVGFVVVNFTDAPMESELPGRIVAAQSSEVRPQIAGIVRRRLFTEGGIVRQGQPLYEIDARVYRAAANEAEANVAAARATAAAARARAERFRPLAEMEAISRQDYDDALAAARAAEAQVAQTAARLDSARINLGFTTITAPIGGRIGRSLVTEGALVTANQAEPLALIQRMDPVFVDIQQSGADLLAMRRALANGGPSPTSVPVHLTLDDGSDYGPTGRLQFAEAVTNEATGTVTLRASFPNPQGLLLPGMFVRARFAATMDLRAALVPQIALIREANGQASVWVLRNDNTVERRTVIAARTLGANWVVTSGLRQGERIVTQGIANLSPGASVRPVPAATPQRIAPPDSPAAATQ